MTRNHGNQADEIKDLSEMSQEEMDAWAAGEIEIVLIDPDYPDGREYKPLGDQVIEFTDEEDEVIFGGKAL